MSHLTEHASATGFRRLVLNTLPAMTDAIALYRSVGFVECEPYTEEPLDETLYFDLETGGG